MYEMVHMFDAFSLDVPMGMGLQGSLLDQTEDIGVLELSGRLRRTVLGDGAWVDIRPGWMTGADTVFSQLRDIVPWQSERRRMYERIVEVPRLVRFYAAGEELPLPLLATARDQLSTYYGAELGEPFVSTGLCYYRDGTDSVAWHGDTIGRSSTTDTMVAIVSVGAPRTLLLRPRGGGDSLRFLLGHGDLLVMGGTCQRTWQHSVPKTASAVGPRLSVTLRHREPLAA